MKTWVKGAVLTRILCALALFVLGFSGHAFADPTFDPYSAQYLLPDGSYSSLCQSGEGKGGAPHNNANHCNTCVTAAAHLFTPPDTMPTMQPVLVRGDIVRIATNSNLKRIVSHHRLSRGPPLSA